MTVNIHCILGLDPAAPLFEFDSEQNRLYSSDAKVVEVLHTYSGSILTGIQRLELDPMDDDQMNDSFFFRL